MVLRKLHAGELLSVHDCRGYTEDGYTWWQVAGEHGTVGWVATQWLEEKRLSPKSAPGTSALEVALG
jgi:hypothetical protein